MHLPLLCLYPTLTQRLQWGVDESCGDSAVVEDIGVPASKTARACHSRKKKLKKQKKKKRGREKEWRVAMGHWRRRGREEGAISKQE